nr:hypothetical protein [uncultured Roseibium sp.]
MTQLSRNDDFIDLNRTFHELSDYASESDDVDLANVFHVGESLTWVDLIKEHRVVILSEAGSGKTEEIRNVASRLRVEGNPAFFLRLEHIPQDFEDAFEVGSYEEFQSWLEADEEGWLLLDSVDEARLRDPGDFQLAVRKLARKLSVAKNRTHIVITGRSSAWRPKSDLAFCSQHLPFVREARPDPIEDENGELDIDLGLEPESTKLDQKKHVFKLVALSDLSSEQILKFSAGRGIQDTAAFLNAVERADAWSFTSRPQDLEELVEFWLDEQKIGSRLELMQNSIRRRLLERDQNRADAQPLSESDARFGVKLLAAATTLSQEPTIRVPDGADNNKGVPVRDILPYWNDIKQAALLSRPVFDEAIYGTVRFHHRSVREYLTAEWFADLLRRETSRRKIENLLFRTQYGVDVVVPALRPVLSWLVLLDEKIRERLAHTAPEVFFEGGDPSQLPRELRRTILHDVCDQLASGSSSRSAADRSAVQRFANTDLVDDLRALLSKYDDNTELTPFLLRMIWLGELSELLPEAQSFAIRKDCDSYTRIAAFRAVFAVGTEQDCADLRDVFLSEGEELDRDWLAELVQHSHPSAKTISWLLSSIVKTKRGERFSADNLSSAIEEFVSDASLELLPDIVSGFHDILNLKPIVERRFCEISQEFGWLIRSAALAVKRLIVARHSAALSVPALEILHKIPAASEYDIGGIRDEKFNFDELICVWPELNRSLFWYEVEQVRSRRENKRAERVSELWQIDVFRTFWKFDEEDFEYFKEQSFDQEELDNRLMALSLAFNLYKYAGRPRNWREQLKKLVSSDAELSSRLQNYLNPAAASEEVKKHRRRLAGFQRRDRAIERKRTKELEESKGYLSSHIDELRDPKFDNPSSVSSAQAYLHEKMRKKNGGTTSYSVSDWKSLGADFGEDVAIAFRDGCVAYWRKHKPKIRSEGAPLNQTTLQTIFGLSGICIEAEETANWPAGFDKEEIDLACRYASFELNGFPPWFSKLAANYLPQVADFMLQEIRYELSIEKPDVETNYMLYDVSWSGQWSWNQIAPSLVKELIDFEPSNIGNLTKLMTIVLGSSITDVDLRELAVEKCRKVTELDNLALWYAVWVGVDPLNAIQDLETKLSKIPDSDSRTNFAMNFIVFLQGKRRRDDVGSRNAYLLPEHLKSLYLLMHQYIRREDDIERAGKGVYSPELRDRAQDARNALFSHLNETPGKEAYLALEEISKSHPDNQARPWLAHLAKSRAEKDADISPWKVQDVLDFHETLERTPSTHSELADLAVMRLNDLKDEIENGDSSIADILKNVTLETDMRNYIGRELREKARGRYSIPQEEELSDAKRPDLRFHGVGFDGPVPCELKLADNGWSGNKLFERLENQLCGDYLRDHRSNRGIFLLVTRGAQKHWEVPNKSGSEKRLDFQGLVDALQSHWQDISTEFHGVDDVTVIGIDLTKRG